MNSFASSVSPLSPAFIPDNWMDLGSLTQTRHELVNRLRDPLFEFFGDSFPAEFPHIEHVIENCENAEHWAEFIKLLVTICSKTSAKSLKNELRFASRFLVTQKSSDLQGEVFTRLIRNIVRLTPDVFEPLLDALFVQEQEQRNQLLTALKPFAGPLFHVGILPRVLPRLRTAIHQNTTTEAPTTRTTTIAPTRDASSFDHIIAIPDIHGDAYAFVQSLYEGYLVTEDSDYRLMDYESFAAIVTEEAQGVQFSPDGDVIYQYGQPMYEPISNGRARIAFVQLGDIPDR